MWASVEVGTGRCWTGDWLVFGGELSGESGDSSKSLE